MTLDDLKRLDVESIADKNCALFMWATLPMLPESLEVIRAWGFEFVTVAFVWVKLNKRWSRKYQEIGRMLERIKLSYDLDAFYRYLNPLFFFGMGYWTRANAEIVLLAKRGKIKRIDLRVGQLIVSPIREHSQKPDETRERIFQLMGDLPRVELFAREKTEGWEAWGNEIKSTIKLGQKGKR
jgi:N6-adenosine-specific RNA methylase IME4